ncbi:hypothetical protein [Novosphingobium sp.]|uniref:hypothetical protein n=1 Tax=Novosphingobium sp. TaxID=1874826 RepID=UPI002FDF03E6
MIPLVLQITDAGRAAMVDPAGGGTRRVTIAGAGLTAQAFIAAPTLTALPGEFKRLATVSGQVVAPDVVHLTVRDSAPETYAVRGIGLYLADGTLFAAYSQADPILEKAAPATFLVAFDWKLAPVDAGAIQFGDAGFLNPPATESVPGVTMLATIAEALAGQVADKALTPAGLGQALASYVRNAQLGAANGVATLGPDGKLALGQRPPIDLIDVWPVGSQAAMLALGATVGDFAVRADNGLVYVLQALPANVLGNWLEISTPAPVSSVNGKVGAVFLGPDEVGAVPNWRHVRTEGPLLRGGGGLTDDLTLALTPASAAEAAAGAAGDRVVTPASLADILGVLNSRAWNGNTVATSGLLTGGGRLQDNPVLHLESASVQDVIDGGNWGKAVTPGALGNLPKSLTPNGFVMLPGGIKLMWVQLRQTITYEQPITVVYPDSFASFVVPLAVTAWNNQYSNTRDMWVQLVGEPGLSSCLVQTQSNSTTNQRIDGINLVLIGK